MQGTCSNVFVQIKYVLKYVIIYLLPCHNRLHLITQPATHVECSEWTGRLWVFDILMAPRSDLRNGRMTYAIEHIASKLKDARKAKGLTQRSQNAALPQSHISKIENGAVDLRVGKNAAFAATSRLDGAVDLRVSSLVELARVLDLELMLVPRRTVSAVQSIIRGEGEGAPLGKKSEGQVLRELAQLQDAAAELVKAHPSDVELAQLAGLVRQLQFYWIPAQHLDTIRSVRRAVQASRTHSDSLETVCNWLPRLRGLRNSLAHELGGGGEGESTRPAYSLDEDQNG